MSLSYRIPHYSYICYYCIIKLPAVSNDATLLIECPAFSNFIHDQSQSVKHIEPLILVWTRVILPHGLLDMGDLLLLTTLL